MSAKNDQGRNGESQGRTAGPELGKKRAEGKKAAAGPEPSETHECGDGSFCPDCEQPCPHCGAEPDECCEPSCPLVAAAEDVLPLAGSSLGWRCGFCGREGNSAAQMFCANCGTTKHQTELAADLAKSERARVEALPAGSSQRWGWTCVVCGRFNAEGNGYCGETGKGCAASKSVTAEAWRREFDAEMGRIKAGSSRPVPEGIRAAALELYAALKALDPQCITVPPCHACAGCDARAALSKAEGRS